ncbi:hypothetical protein BGZ97_004927 [Linnemannia gamsii]|jgi:hypothetical protein|uniref:Uncharacterized protein n=1 Tax=Linnemannia gamsii TaxID=64522 RepID=A0A9P6UGI2_9FUNG|nr:hypothetical protein BGZ97_004927 [Linnemannia gamsii]
MFTTRKISLLVVMVASVGILGLTSINSHGPTFALAAPAPAPVLGSTLGSFARVRRDDPDFASGLSCEDGEAGDQVCADDCFDFEEYESGYCKAGQCYCHD